MTTDQRAGAAIPMLSYEDPARAADWVAEAFGFRENGRWADADGRVTHVNMERSGAVIMLGSSGRDYQNPRHHSEVYDHARARLTTPFVVDGVLVYVDDIDTHFEREGVRGDRPVPARRQLRGRSATVSRRGSGGPPLDVRSADLNGSGPDLESKKLSACSYRTG